VVAVAADITTAEGRTAVLAACPDPDILVNNAGGPPIGDFRDWDEATWMKAVNDNMITPIMLIRAVVDGMIARRFGRIVNITSRSVKAPLADLGLSNGARTGLTGFVAGLAPGREAQRRHQQSSAGALCHRPADRRFAQALGEGRTGLRQLRQSAHGRRAGGTLRYAGRVRPRLRVPLQRRRGLHRRP
jgi:NAD(P)-dependent dehydrogenase (short-subunit alcohol dehydrogenase family)